MSALDNLDDALLKAVEAEQQMLETTGSVADQHRRRANLYFKRAMILDGHAGFTGKVI